MFSRILQSDTGKVISLDGTKAVVLLFEHLFDPVAAKASIESLTPDNRRKYTAVMAHLNDY